MRSVIAATLAVVVGLVVANMLGVAAAEAPTATTPLRSVSVEGVATVPIAQDANLSAATAAYRQAQADAMADGQSKAEFLASHAGVTLAGVQSIVEGGGGINCTTDEESSYAQYEGERPDFGSPTPTEVAPAVEGIKAAPTVHRPTLKPAKKHPTAKKASVATCTLTAEVTLVYAIS